MRCALYKGNGSLKPGWSCPESISPRAHPTTTPTNPTAIMPPKKKATPANTNSNATSDPPTTRTVRSSARVASQAIVMAANSDSTADGATSSKPASKTKARAATNSKPPSKTTRPASKTRSKRTKADADDEEDETPVSKKPKTATVDEDEEEDDMDVDTEDDRKMVTLPLCQWFAPADLHLEITVLRRGAAPVDPHSGMVGQCPTASIQPADN